MRLASGTTYVKMAMTLAAYRGTDATNPVASIVGAAEPGSSTSHTTPSVANATNGAWRVSYWSDKNSATSTWTAPGGGESSRASTVGSGGGRVSSLLTDSNAALTAGAPASTGALVARDQRGGEQRDGVDDPAAPRLLISRYRMDGPERIRPWHR